MLPERLEEFLERLFDNDAESSFQVESWLTADDFVSLYTTAFECCVSRSSLVEGSSSSSLPLQGAVVQGELLYADLVYFLAVEAFPIIAERIASSSASRNVLVYLSEWKRFSDAVAHIEAVFQYLDRFWVPRQLELSSRRIMVLGDILKERASLVSERVQQLPVGHVRVTCLHLWDVCVLEAVESAVIFPKVNLLLHSVRETSMANHLQQLEAQLGNGATLRAVVEKELIPADLNLIFASYAVLEEACKSFSHRLSPLYHEILKESIDSRVLVIEEITSVEQVQQLLILWEFEDALARVLFPFAVTVKSVLEVLKQRLLVPLMQHLTGVVSVALSDPEGCDRNGIRVVFQLLSKRRTLLPVLATDGIRPGLIERLRRLKATDSVVLTVFEQWIFAKDLVFRVLNNEPVMMEAVMEAFSIVLNCPEAEMDHSLLRIDSVDLARWFDEQLGHSSDKELTSQMQISDLMKEQRAYLMALFRFIPNMCKQFLSSFAHLLGRRLILAHKERSFHRYLDGVELFEEQMIKSYGQGSVGHLRRMLLDSESSRKLTKEYLPLKRRLSFEMSFTTMSANSWPVFVDSNVMQSVDLHQLPGIGEHVGTFEQCYFEHHRRRKLIWSAIHSTVDVMWRGCNGKEYRLLLTAVQYAILMALEAFGSMNLKRLVQQSKISMDGLTSSIGSLSRLVQVGLVSNSSDDGRGGQFAINDSFESAHAFVDLSQLFSFNSVTSRMESTSTLWSPVSMDISSESSAKSVSVSDMAVDRSFAMQAHAVRYLKLHREISVDRLCMEMKTDLETLAPMLLVLKEKEYISFEEEHPSESTVLSYIP